ncbi:Fe-S cluster assembly protein HesB [Paenibacillus sp. N1-5-1-14]|uniref:HesB/YadR/YfhF family protein n=1 Tax=Paenibacillus radicibacter TaxID=2972488 RepID=UPI002158EFF5|nr:Fe-S cluster assembly protein HesB [Paenibacillus radicibacter]MCR8643163.1 Fe-S cluster assembly protein HesB [Paenibacillus radicibacter]
MNLTVTKDAVACFKDVWGYQSGEHVRIFVRYSGGSEDAFAFGISRHTPIRMAISHVEGDITFFMEENDVWFLNDKDLQIDCQAEEITFVLT